MKKRPDRANVRSNGEATRAEQIGAAVEKWKWNKPNQAAEKDASKKVMAKNEKN